MHWNTHSRSPVFREPADSLTVLCIAHCYADEPDRARPLGQESVERARQLGDDVLLGRSLMGYLLASHRIDPARAEQLYPEAIRCTERSGDRYINHIVHNNAGYHA